LLRREKLLFGCAIFMAVSTVILYFINFHAGFSNDASDWGSFGSYLAGTITIPFSFLTLYFIYKTYITTQQTLTSNTISTRITEAHSAIKEASNFVEESLDSSVEFIDGKITFRELHIDLNYFKHVPLLIPNDKHFTHRYKISVAKPFLCLYDFLKSAESEFGITPTIRFYKIRYQWLINLHNEYKLGVLDIPKHGITSKQMEEYFYNIN